MKSGEILMMNGVPVSPAAPGARTGKVTEEGDTVRPACAVLRVPDRPATAARLLFSSETDNSTVSPGSGRPFAFPRLFPEASSWMAALSAPRPAGRNRRPERHRRSPSRNYYPDCGCGSPCSTGPTGHGRASSRGGSEEEGGYARDERRGERRPRPVIVSRAAGARAHGEPVVSSQRADLGLDASVRRRPGELNGAIRPWEFTAPRAMTSKP